MAAKRLLAETEPRLDPTPEKKRSAQTLASRIGDVVMVKSLGHFFKTLEPLLRNVVNEEVDRCLTRYSRSLTGASSLSIQALDPFTIRLYFVNNLPSTLFTGSKITDVENQPLRIAIEDGGGDLASQILSTLKIEVVLLDGDFPAGANDEWTAEEFNAGILTERSRKRPLLRGDTNVDLRHGAATIGDIEFTDNSSWTRSKRFRLGARIVSESDRGKGPRIREAVTEPFVVKDHRGELYKKHYPPMLHDEVWRLEKIGKEGVFHKKLSNHNIKSVQEFLQLLTIDPQKLRTILGVGMSEKMWEATVKHAKTCELGNKLYMYRGHGFLLFLNPICEVVRAIIGEHVYSLRELHNISEEYLKSLRRQAFDNWHSLQDFEGCLRDSLLPTQGNEESDYIIGIGKSSSFKSGEVEGRDRDSNSDQFINSATKTANFHNNYG